MYGILATQLGLIFAIVIFVLYPILTYFYDSKNLRRFPSVSIAGITNAWGVSHQLLHSRTAAIHRAHHVHGKIVRVGPSHVSFATIEAIKDIYGHGTKCTKDDFYSAFASTHLNISDAQDKAVHNTKRRRFAQAFAQKSIVELETVMDQHLKRMMEYIDQHRGLPSRPELFDMKFVILTTLYDVNCVTLFNQDPRFLERNTMSTTAETVAGKKYVADLYQGLVRSGNSGTAAGYAPKSMGWVKFLTKWHDGWRRGGEVRDINIHLLRNRLRMDSERIKAGQKPLADLMTTILWDKDGTPLCLEFGEMVTEATNMFSAAGENTEIATTNVVYFLAKNPQATSKLREELDAALGDDRSTIPSYTLIKDLPYLRACIDEGIRLRPSIEGGLPRVVPKGGMSVSGEWLKEGTTVSVSTRTIHRDPGVFGERPEEFVPERWLHEGSAAMQKGFLGFSQGGRGCIGRNIAYFEMQLLIATLIWKYDLSLSSPDWELGITESFSAHTLEMPMTVTLRN